MIAYLSGVVAMQEINRVIVDVGGVGYGVQVSVQDRSKLLTKEPVKLFIYENIREDSHDLYGFLDETSRQLFEQLLSVKNVGPKVALSVIDIGNETMVRTAIANGDVKLLQSAKGVGKRAAEQMVVELRDKVGLGASEQAESLVSRGGVDKNDEAAQALVALGYSDSDAATVLADIDKSLSTEERVKLALKGSIK
jgi:holliday junction DNA helicase RuvA